MKIALALSLALLASPVLAEQRLTIQDDFGGKITEYEERAEALRHTPIRLSGSCESACTIFLMTKYNLDVCAVPGTTLAFHMPYNKQAYSDGSLEMIIDKKVAAKNFKRWRREWLGHFSPELNEILDNNTVAGRIPNPNESGDTSTMFVVDALKVLPRCKS